MISVVIDIILLAASVLADTTLMQGLQAVVFPYDTSTECLASFNTSIRCDRTVSMLYVQQDWAGWNATNLTVLCTADCRNDLASLERTVVSACGDLSFALGGTTMTPTLMFEFWTYKFNLSCLADGSSWCILEQRGWFVEHLPTVTWPTYTEKWYPDWENDPVNGTNYVDNGTTILPFWTAPPPQPTFNSGRKASLDYRYHGPGPANGSLGPNSQAGLGLEYDEYPLEIQCSKCFLERFKLGLASRWGETYNEIKHQAWSNMKKNCGLTEDLYVHPLLDVSGPPNDDDEAIGWSSAVNLCDRNVTLLLPDDSPMNCTSFSLTYNVATSTLRDLNKGLNCGRLANGTYCLPLPCQLEQFFVDGGIPATDLLPNLTNVSYSQFIKWNAAALHGPGVLWGDSLCKGPPGGAYTPALVSGALATPSTYTTTATPALETPPGTVINCGLYYNVQAGDFCNTIALNFSITLAQLHSWNPQINENCTNLWANASYCVALLTETRGGAVSTTLSTGHNTNFPTGTGIVSPPALVASGSTSTCCEWYIVQSGDYCYLIYTKYSITFEQFLEWNSGVNEACDNLQPGYSYCIKGF